jgi:ATP-dependent helicase HrpA
VVGHPALVDEGTTVGVRVFGTEQEQATWHRRGLRRLLLLGLPSPAKALADGMTNVDKLELAGSPYPTVRELLEDCAAAAVDALVDRHGLVWDQAAFEALAADVGSNWGGCTRAVLADVLRVLPAWRDVDRLLSGSADLVMLPALTDMRGQVGRLVHRGFVSEAGAAQLRELPRYLAAVQTRRQRLPSAIARDRALMDQVVPLQEAYLHRMSALPDGSPPSDGLVRVRWMLEELRVSLWDQARGTKYPVSPIRVRKAIDTL